MSMMKMARTPRDLQTQRPQADAAAAEGADEPAADHEILQDLNAPARTEEQLQSSRLPAEIPHTREGV